MISQMNLKEGDIGVGRKGIAVSLADNSAATRQASSVRTAESPNLQTSLTTASSRDSVDSFRCDADALLQTFDAKLAAIARLDLDDAVGVEQQAIARRNFRFGSLKLRVRNDPYRRSGGIRAHDDRLHFARTSAHLQRRWMTCASETGDASL